MRKSRVRNLRSKNKFSVRIKFWETWRLTRVTKNYVANIHHYWPPPQWITVKYRSNACQIEIVKYVQSIGIELSLLISIWLSLRNLQIPGFTTFVPFKAHSVISNQTTSRKKPSSSRGGGGGRIFRALTAFYILEDFR